MSYLVLARKYRPQTFEEVVSQSHISSTLQNAIKQQRLSHAYLFTGTRGTGKTTTARLLAKALNCENGPTPTPCNKCTNCMQITKSSSMDVLEIDAASRTSVENIRELQESVHYSPSSSPYKIYIIDEVHRLSGSAFDALLKTLEEPPSHVIFIFATTDPQKLPATILSRCQRYDFRRIPFRDMNAHLRELADKEKINIDDDALALISQKGDGSLRDALSIFEQVIACAEDKITREIIADTLGLVDLDLLFNLTDTIVNKDTSAALELVENMFASGVDISQFISDFQEHFRKILIVNSSDKPFEYLAVSDYFQEKYVALKDKFTDNDIFRVVKMLSDLQSDLKAGADPAIFLEIAILRLVKMESSIMLEDVLRKLSNLESTGATQGPNMFDKPATSAPASSNPGMAKNNPALPPANKPSSTKSDSEKKTDKLGSTPSARMATPLSWNDFVEQVKSDKHMLGDFLSYGELTRMDSESIELTYSSNGDIYHNHISKKENQRLLAKHMKILFGKSLRLVTKVDKNRQPEMNANGGDPRYDITPEELFKKKPDMKKMADRLGGEIKSVKMYSDKGEENG